MPSRHNVSVCSDLWVRLARVCVLWTKCLGAPPTCPNSYGEALTPVSWFLEVGLWEVITLEVMRVGP